MMLNKNDIEFTRKLIRAKRKKPLLQKLTKSQVKTLYEICDNLLYGQANLDQKNVRELQDFKPFIQHILKMRNWQYLKKMFKSPEGIDFITRHAQDFNKLSFFS